LQTFESLKKEKEDTQRMQRAEAKNAEEEHGRRRRNQELEENRSMIEEAQERQEANLKTREGKEGSEVDYGIEASKSSPKLPKVSAMKASSQGHPIAGRRGPTKTPQTLITRAGALLRNLKTLLEELARSWKMNPIALLKTLTFVLGILMTLGRSDVRDRVSIMWLKMRQTIGMGVKVSYV